MSVPRIDSSIDMRALFQGAFVGSVALTGPVVRVVIERTKDTKAVHAPPAYIAKVLSDLVPLKLNRVQINGGRAFLVATLDLPGGGTRRLDLKASNIQARAENLTNSEKLSTDLFANAEAIIDGDISLQSVEAGK